MNDRGVRHSAAPEQRAPGRQHVVDQVHHLRDERVPLQQAAELQDRRLIRQRVLDQLQSGRAAHRLDLVERILHRAARERVPLLQRINPQHCLKRHRRAAATPRRRVVRFDQHHQFRPRHHLLRLRQELLPARLPLLGAKASARQRWSASTRWLVAVQCGNFTSGAGTRSEVPWSRHPFLPVRLCTPLLVVTIIRDNGIRGPWLADPGSFYKMIELRNMEMCTSAGRA